MSEARHSFFRRMTGHSVRFAAGLFVVGSVLRLTVRDSIPILSAIFYGTPLPVLVVSGLYVGVGLAIARRFRWATVAAVTAVVWGVVWMNTQFCDNGDHESADHPNDRFVLLWNMQNGASGWDGAFNWVRDQRPDIAGLVESHHDYRQLKFATGMPSGYACSESHRGLTIVVRGSVGETEDGRLGKYGIYQSAQVTVDGQSFRVIVVDLISIPFLSRRPAIVELRKVADRYIDEPLLIMGDFNTPYDSVHFDLLSTDFAHAFREHGNGYAATWPLPLPLMELDHLWFNDKIVATRCAHTESENSDHRAVELHCRIAE